MSTRAFSDRLFTDIHGNLPMSDSELGQLEKTFAACHAISGRFSLKRSNIFVPETRDSVCKRKADGLMKLERTEAEAFIRDYQLVLLMLTTRRDAASRQDFLADLMDGRRKLADQPELIDVAPEKLDAKGVNVDPCVAQAIRTLRLREWIYLRDTRYYSIFLDSESDAALAVVGLTDRLLHLLGGSGVYFEAGVVEYAGEYVCDGLLNTVALLGPDYRRSCNEAYGAIRKAGGFQRRPETRLQE